MQSSDHQDQDQKRSADAVAQDIDAIFAPLRDRVAAVAPTPAPRGAVRSVRATATRGRLTPAIGSGVAAVLVAISLGAMWAKPLLEEQSRSAATRAVLAQVPMPTSAVPPAPAYSIPPPAAAAALASSAVSPAYRPYAPAQTLTKASAPAPAVREQNSGPPSACSDLTGHRRQACHHSRVMSADRQLRRAYARAADAGVSRPVMVAYRNRWAGLRRDASNNPGRVVRGYGAMATQLSREAQAARQQRG